MNKKLIVLLGVAILILVLALVFAGEKEEAVVVDEEIENDLINDTLIGEEGVVDEAETQTVNVYYVEVIDGTENVIPVEREVDLANGVEESTLLFLLEGVSGDVDYSSSIPEGTELLSFELENGIAFADFNENLQEGVAGSAWVSTIRDQIEKTLMQFDTVDEVIIMVEGETEEVLQP